MTFGLGVGVCQDGKAELTLKMVILIVTIKIDLHNRIAQGKLQGLG